MLACSVSSTSPSAPHACCSSRATSPWASAWPFSRPAKRNSRAPKRGESELISRDVSHLFGHEDLVILQRKGRFELPHVKAFRELVEIEFKAEAGD